MAMVLLGILLAGCAADRVHRQGLAAIERGDYASGVGLLEQADHDDPRLKTRDNHKVTLQLRDAPTKMVFEVLSRETGINFVLDKDVKSDTKTTIFVQDVPVEQAIDLVLDQNALARQILADNMVLIYPNIAAKQKDYEQLIVRTFYLTNAVPKDAESMLKAVLAAKTMFVDERTNVLVIRDTPDVVRMAE